MNVPYKRKVLIVFTRCKQSSLVYVHQKEISAVALKTVILVDSYQNYMNVLHHLKS